MSEQPETGSWWGLVSVLKESREEFQEYVSPAAAAVPALCDPDGALKAAMLGVLADGKIRALADLKIRMLEAIDGRPAPADYDGFVAFAARAGVSRSKRYEAAARWGRSATAVVPEPEK